MYEVRLRHSSCYWYCAVIMQIITILLDEIKNPHDAMHDVEKVGELQVFVLTTE